MFEQERRMLENAGHEVISYSRSNWDTDAYRGLKRFHLAKRTIWASDSREDFLELLKREKPDVVHVHNTFVMISPSIYSACQEVNIPVIQTLHNYRLMCPTGTFFREGRVCEECLHSSLWRGIEHSCYHNSHLASAVVASMLLYHRLRDTWNREVSAFIALSEFARRKFIEGGLPGEKIFVKPNFVSPDPGNRKEAGDYVLFVGRLSPEKGVKTIVAAWKQLTLAVPLVVIGAGAEQAQLAEQASKENLPIEFKGQLPREQTLAAMNKARFTIVSSQWYETFCLAITESFACSSPVICSRMGVMQELVDDQSTGLHFNPADPADLARKVEWAWTHASEMQAMGVEARKQYEAKYTAEKNYPQLMNIYESMLQKSRGLRV